MTDREQPISRQSAGCPLDHVIAAACSRWRHLPLPEAVLCYQQLALRQTLAQAAKSRFYQRLFAWQRFPQHLFLTPPDLAPDKSADESAAVHSAFMTAFTALPCTTAEDLARDWRDFLCVSQDTVARIVTLPTSGTTGNPKRIAFSAADLEQTVVFFSEGMRQLVRTGDTVLVLLPGAQRPFGVTDLLRQALPRLGARVVTGQPEATPETLCTDFACKPQCVIAAPSQLAQLLRAQSQAFPHLNLRGLLSSAEPLPPELGRELAATLGCVVLDHYGLTESGYGGGVECLAHDGYHLRETDLYCEIVDPSTGHPLPDGTEGELVLTTLGREAMPLIRYRTGDVSTLLPGPCRCGSPLRRLAPIRGRLVRDTDTLRVLSLPKGTQGAVHPELN